jgi:hypothetical protein
VAAEVRQARGLRVESRSVLSRLPAFLKTLGALHWPLTAEGDHGVAA